MNRFEDLWKNAVKQLGNQALEEHLDKLNFPGQLAVLANRGFGLDAVPLRDKFIDFLSQEVAKHPALQPHRVDATKIKALLTALLVDRQDLSGILDGSHLQRLIVEVATEEAAEQLAERLPVPIRPKEVRQAAQLLMTGEFFRDIGATTTTVISTIPKIPVSLVKDVERLAPLRVHQLVLAALKDATELPLAARTVFSALVEGNILGHIGALNNVVGPNVIPDHVLRGLTPGTLRHNREVMGHTLTWLYEIETVKTVADLVSDLISPENESLRLALVIYARANGIPIEQRHLDVLRQSVLDTDSPDLTPALKEGVEFLLEQYGQPELQRILGRLINI